eukprot:COSAG02_NODE_498_length_21087_cov_33.272394_16_plen_339_part_00
MHSRFLAAAAGNKRPRVEELLGDADQDILRKKGDGADGSVAAIYRELKKTVFFDADRDLPVDERKLNAKDARNFGAAVYGVAKQSCAVGMPGLWPLPRYGEDCEDRPASAAPTTRPHVLGGAAGAQVWDPVENKYKWVRAPSEITATKDATISQLEATIETKDQLIADKDATILTLQDQNTHKEQRLALLGQPGSVFSALAEVVGLEMLTRFSRQCSAIRLLGIALVSRLKLEVRGIDRRFLVPLFVEGYPHGTPQVKAWASHSKQRIVVLDADENWTRLVGDADAMVLLGRIKDGRSGAAASGNTGNKKHTLGNKAAELIVAHLHFDGTDAKMVGEL